VLGALAVWDVLPGCICVSALLHV